MFFVPKSSYLNHINFQTKDPISFQSSIFYHLYRNQTFKKLPNKRRVKIHRIWQHNIQILMQHLINNILQQHKLLSIILHQKRTSTRTQRFLSKKKSFAKSFPNLNIDSIQSLMKFVSYSASFSYSHS